MSVLVLGIGNILLMDEGVGVRVVEEMQRRYFFPPEVKVLDGGTLGIDLLSYLQKKDHLIIIDAIKSGHPPGTVVRVEGEDIPAKIRADISSHQLGLSEVLAMAQLTGELPRQRVLFGIEPKHIETGLDLSKEVKDNLNKVVEIVIRELRALGYSVDPLP